MGSPPPPAPLPPPMQKRGAYEGHGHNGASARKRGACMPKRGAYEAQWGPSTRKRDTCKVIGVHVMSIGHLYAKEGRIAYEKEAHCTRKRGASETYRGAVDGPNGRLHGKEGCL